MKFLTVNGKFVRNSAGKLITVPDNYDNEPLKLDGKLLTFGGAVIGSKTSTLPKLATPQNVTVDGTTVSWDPVENATSYDVCVDGVLYENVGGSSGETWVLNETLSTDFDLQSQFIRFTSAGENFKGLGYASPAGGYLFYYQPDGEIISVHMYAGGWHGLYESTEKYRTVTFTTPPTGILLAWLQANGTKQ